MASCTNHVHEITMKPVIFRELWVERGGKHVVLPCRDDRAILKPGKHFNL